VFGRKSRASLLYQPALYQRFGGTRYFQNVGTYQTRRRHIREECDAKYVDVEERLPEESFCIENVTEYCNLQGGGNGLFSMRNQFTYIENIQQCGDDPWPLAT
jgi:hypothetical protein